MAENENTNVNETPEVDDVESIKAELERAKAESAKFKSAVDKLTREAAEKKREERAKMTAEEQARAEQAEEFERLKAKAEQDAIELNHLKAVNAYKNIDSDTVEKLIDAINDKDHSAIANLINAITEKAIKEKEAEWKKNRPSAIIGEGSLTSMSKEEIMAIKDPIERQKKIAENLHLFQ